MLGEGLSLHAEPVESSSTKFDMVVALTSSSEGLNVDITYSTDLFEAGTVSRMLSHYEQLLQAVVSNPASAIQKLEMLGVAEKQLLLQGFNDTKTAWSSAKRVIDLFEEQAARTPEQTAIIWRDESFSYSTLNAWANRLAHYLQSEGIGEGSLVPVCVERSPEMIVAILSILKSGAAYVPVDTQYPAERIRLIFEDISGPVALVNAHDHLPDIKDLPTRLIYINQYLQYPAVDPERIPSGSSLISVIYTSGSSGTPKGVKVLDSAMQNRLQWMWTKYPFEPGERFALKTSLGFADHMWELFGPLLKGVPAVLFNNDDVLDIDGFLQQLSAHRITRLVLVPSLLRYILNRVEAGELDLSALKYWTSSGEELASDLVEEFYMHFSPENHKLLNIYGSTEVTADVTCYDTSLPLLKETKGIGESVFEISLKGGVQGLINDFTTRPEITRIQEEWLLPEEYFDVSISKTVKPEEYISFIKNNLLPHVVNVNNPNYIGHMTGMVPEFIKELSALMIVLNQNLVKIETSFAASFIERQVLGIIHKQIFRLKDTFYEKHVQNERSCLGIIANGGTLSNITALSYALNKAFPPDGDFKGITEEGLLSSLQHYGYNSVVVIGSELMHYSIGKALRVLGLGRSNCITFDFDTNNIEASREELTRKINALRKENVLVLAIIGVAGTTETGRVDPLTHLGSIAQQFGIHYHVDGAFGGSYIFSQKLARKLKGIEYADSVTICGHKQMFLPQGASMCIFKSPELAVISQNMTFYQARKGSYDLGKYTIEGSRSFVSLLFHGVLKILGEEKLGGLIESNYEKTRLFAAQIKANEHFELFEEPTLNIIIYRYIPSSLREKARDRMLSIEDMTLINALNRRLQKLQFLRGRSFVSFTELPMKGYPDNRVVVMRIVVMNPYTSIEMFNDLLEEQVTIADEIIAKKNFSPFDFKFSRLKSEMPALKRQSIPIGKPIDNAGIYIVDNAGNLCPVGIPGELLVGGSLVSPGYFNRPELNNEKFIPHPFSDEPGAMLFRTGDLARWQEDGNLVYLGRKDNQVKLRGFRIEPGEIEQVLEKAENVRQAVVVMQGEESNRYLAAYVVCEGPFNKPALLTYLMSRLPDYMVPSTLTELDELPLTPNGKIDRRSLAAQDSTVAGNSYEAPQSSMEYRLVDIWQQLLKKERIGVTDNFFELGGHSLLATRVVSRIRHDLDRVIAIRDIFTYPTVRSLAGQLHMNADEVLQPGIIAGARPERIPLSFSQERLWFIDQLQGSQEYHIPGVFRLIGAVNVDALRYGLQQVINRHEVLRSVLKSEHDQVWQQVLPEDQWELVYHKEAMPLSDIRDQIREVVALPFDLGCDHMLRAHLFKVTAEDHLLVIVLHHIASDGWSLPILVKEFISFYQQAITGISPSLPALPAQYADYAIWQHRNLSGPHLDMQLAYWQNRLNNSQPLELPADHVRPARHSGRGGTMQYVLPAALQSSLEQLSRQEGVTMFMTLLSV
ncbi:AMP-binding protein, partial [Chitinophaga sp. GbtcB8]|uniref:AMP-binding protein n=1 Tax=Chitinophaga sp. GbtcB8 TaxID=2824753 RepID=UPI0020C70124